MTTKAGCSEADDKEDEKEATFCSYKIAPCSVSTAPAYCFYFKRLANKNKVCPNLTWIEYQALFLLILLSSPFPSLG